MKRIFRLLLCVAILCSLAATVQAADVGSISVKIQYQGKNITGGKLTAICVGALDARGTSYVQVTDGKLIENIGKAEAVTAMEKLYKDKKTTYAFREYTAEVKDGVAKFENLPAGLYLIRQEKAASGYSPLASFLVTLPYEESMDVTVESKAELKREPTPTKPSDKNPDEKLPQTGQVTWPVPVMAASGLFLFFLGLAMCSRKEDYAQ